MTMIYTIIRLLLGLLFITSGWVKAVDPMGVSYKIAEYATTFNMEWIADIALPAAIFLCAMELFIGLMLFFKLWQKAISYFTLLFMLFFTLITLYLVVVPDLNVKDCGCFGEAFILSNTETFIKNIVFLLLTFLYARKNFISSKNSGNKFYYDTSFMSVRKKRQLKLLRFGVYLYIFSFSLIIPIYSAIYLPPYTYLPYDIGTNLRESRQILEEESVTKLIYENITTGEKRKFDVDDSEWQDDTKWKYVDTETTGGSATPLVSGLTLYDSEKKYVTEEVVGKDGYTFLLIAQNIKDVTYPEIKKLENLYRMKSAEKITLVVATTSPIENAATLLDRYGWNNIDIYNGDLVQLKSVLRDKKGILLLHDGVISGKWNFRGNILKNISYNDLSPLISWEKNTITIYFFVVGLFMAIMLYLVVVYHRTRR